jgi:phage tail protein X
MATTCRTSDGDMLDTICQHFYGHLRGTVEAVLEANEGLAREPQPFRVGLLIVLPDLPVAVATASVALWD